MWARCDNGKLPKLVGGSGIEPLTLSMSMTYTGFRRALGPRFGFLI
jgi:hypothetical protein